MIYRSVRETRQFTSKNAKIYARNLDQSSRHSEQFVYYLVTDVESVEDAPHAPTCLCDATERACTPSLCRSRHGQPVRPIQKTNDCPTPFVLDRPTFPAKPFRFVSILRRSAIFGSPWLAGAKDKMKTHFIRCKQTLAKCKRKTRRPNLALLACVKRFTARSMYLSTPAC